MTDLFYDTIEEERLQSNREAGIIPASNMNKEDINMSNQEKKVVAIYARKSKMTGKGKSIENQIEMCRNYVCNHQDFAKYDVKVYTDEGISGKNFDRPNMQLLLDHIKSGEVAALVCYRLDRVSRSVRDFSSLIDFLEKNGSQFVSVSESFDTSTPMGRAMIMICSVFAQLERETIAERISDNLFSLAKMGRWLGGNAPLGFCSQRIVERDDTGQKRSRVRLEAAQEEQELVKLIFSKYLELGSLTQLEIFLYNLGCQTRNGNDYGRYVLKTMLSNPVYCIADDKVYKFLVENGYGIYADRGQFDGEHGLIAYNKNNNRGQTQRTNPTEEWIVAVGEHAGVVFSDTWCAVQRKLQDNSKLSYYRPKKSEAILSGMVKCGCCGGRMRPRTARRAKNGELRYSYSCVNKEKSHGKQCRMPNALGAQLDDLVLDEIMGVKDKVIAQYAFLEDTLSKMEQTVSNQSVDMILTRDIKQAQTQLSSLLDALGRSTNEATSDNIIQRMNELNQNIAKWQKQLNEKRSSNVSKLRAAPGELLAESILQFDKEHFKELPAQKRHNILSQVIKEIIWDGENAEIHFWAEDFPEIQSA